MIVRYEESFEKDLKSVKDIKLRKRIIGILEEIKNAQSLNEIRGIKKLKSYETYYRIRIGDYRIGIEIVEGTVILTRFLHRKDIYKYFP